MRRRSLATYNLALFSEVGRLTGGYYASSSRAIHDLLIAGNVIPLGQYANIRLDDRWRRGLSRLQQWRITWHTRVERKRALGLRGQQVPPYTQVGDR